MTDNENNNEEKAQEYPSDCDNLEFKYQRIEFFPDDVEKMKHMTLKEENEYLSKLKAEGRYVVVYDDENEDN